MGGEGGGVVGGEVGVGLEVERGGDVAAFVGALGYVEAAHFALRWWVGWWWWWLFFVLMF